MMLTLATLSGLALFAQNEDKGQLSGNLLLNTQKYIRDDSIGAITKVYKQNTAGFEGWLYLNYRIKGYSFILRYDAFNNSPLLNPQGSTTAHGIGFYQINKKVDRLEITAGSFYDQLGSGLLFRAYEQRQIGIDYALQGLRLQYDFSPNLKAKAFGGNQKGSVDNRFGYTKQVVLGANLEGFVELGSASRFGSLTLGASFLNRTLDDGEMSKIVSTINNYPLNERFIPKYNVYGGNGYFSWSLGNFTWNSEYTRKSKEAIRIDNQWENHGGEIIYTSMSWGKSGIKLGKQKASIGVNVQGRHIDKFSMRTSPNELLLNGLLAYMPSLTRQNTYRLLARYNAPAQELGEDGVQGEIDIRPSKKTQITLNGSYVQSLPSNGKNGKAELLYREYYGEIIQSIKKVKIKLGLQSIEYNQAVYEQEPSYRNVHTFTPFGEVQWTMKNSRGLRFEWQYLHTREDQGSFANAMLEFYLNAYFTFAVGDMVNVQPHRYENMVIAKKVLHYPTIFASYNRDKSVYTLAFIKQQQGVNCSGGICRIEPAFSGIRFTVSTNF